MEMQSRNTFLETNEKLIGQVGVLRIGFQAWREETGGWAKLGLQRSRPRLGMV